VNTREEKMPRKGSKKYKYKKDAQFTTWCFTHNNWTENDEAYYQELTFPSPDRKISSIAWAREIGKKGTPHLQGFLQLYKKSMKLYNRLTVIRTVIQFFNIY